MLPELPARHKAQEAEFGLVFRKWINKYSEQWTDSCAFELKHTRGATAFAFSELSIEQIAFAASTEVRGELVRIPGTKGEPDYEWMAPGTVTYVVIRYPKFWCIIPKVDVVAEKKASKRKSLSVERAREIAINVIDL